MASSYRMKGSLMGVDRTAHGLDLRLQDRESTLKGLLCSSASASILETTRLDFVFRFLCYGFLSSFPFKVFYEYPYSIYKFTLPYNQN